MSGFLRKTHVSRSNTQADSTSSGRSFFSPGNEATPFFPKHAQAANKAADLIQQKPAFETQESVTGGLSLIGARVPPPMVESVNGNILATVYFAQNSFLLLSDNLKAVEQLSEQVRSMPDPTVIVDGYASAEGKSEYNQQLSELRRFAVSAIISSGTGDLNIQGKAYGASSPAIEETDSNPAKIEQQRRLNRRASIFITTNPKPKTVELSFDFRSNEKAQKETQSEQNLTAKIPKKQSLLSQVSGTKDAVENNLLRKMNVPKALRPFVKDAVYELLKNAPKKKIQLLIRFRF